VYYHDPVVGKRVAVRPTTGRRPESTAESLIGAAHHETDAVPWLTGSTIALFTGVVVAVAILALTTELAAHVAPWLAIVAVVIVTAGLVPSLWLARGQPILRRGALGAVRGIARSGTGSPVGVPPPPPCMLLRDRSTPAVRASTALRTDSEQHVLPGWNHRMVLLARVRR